MRAAALLKKLGKRTTNNKYFSTMYKVNCIMITSEIFSQNGTEAGERRR